VKKTTSFSERMNGLKLKDKTYKNLLIALKNYQRKMIIKNLRLHIQKYKVKQELPV
jgi:hypothetical protein